MILLAAAISVAAAARASAAAAELSLQIHQQQEWPRRLHERDGAGAACTADDPDGALVAAIGMDCTAAMAAIAANPDNDAGADVCLFDLSTWLAEDVTVGGICCATCAAAGPMELGGPELDGPEPEPEPEPEPTACTRDDPDGVLLAAIGMDCTAAMAAIAVGETVILLHPYMPL